MQRRLTVLLLAVLLASFATIALPTAPASAQPCPELVINGGFETNAGWQLGVSPVPAQYVTYTAHTGARSLQLGITSGANAKSFSSARQVVSIPAGQGPVTLSFWYYAMAEAPATTDYMELALLSADGSVILAKPWQSHNDSRLWNQMAFDLSAWHGQTFQIYFNVFNDGVGGRAALFLDDVSLTACSPSTAQPTWTPTATGTPIVQPPTWTPTVTSTVMSGCTELVRNGDFSGGLGDWQVVGDPNGVGLSQDPRRSAPYALKVGALDRTLNGLASARQLVNIPNAPYVVLDVWVYSQLQANPGADYQEISILNSMGGLVYAPLQGPTNDSAWQHFTFSLAAFAGQTVYLRFAVNNDGQGGRAVMFVDDVHLTACSAPPTVAPTATWTPQPPTATWTPGPTATWTPVPTYNPPPVTSQPPPLPQGCAELTRNGGFEAGLAGWFAPRNVLMPAIVTTPVLAGSYAMQLGSTTESRNSYSSIRQTVTVPGGYPRTVISFWTYTWSAMPSAGDRQEFVLLGPGNVVWATPWKVLENNQAWQQHIFELVGTAGQSFDVYFAAINDGVGGPTALFLDEVHLYACTGDASPFEAQPSFAQQQAQPASTEVVPVAQTYPPQTLVAPLSEQSAGAALANETPGVPTADWTQVGIRQEATAGSGPPTMVVVVVTATPALPPPLTLGPRGVQESAIEATPTPLISATAGPQTARFWDRWPKGWQYVVGVLVLIIVIAVIWSLVRGAQNQS